MSQKFIYTKETTGLKEPYTALSDLLRSLDIFETSEHQKYRKILNLYGKIVMADMVITKSKLNHYKKRSEK